MEAPPTGEVQTQAPSTEEQSIAEVLGEQDSDLLQIQAQIEAGEYDIPKAWLNLKIAQIEDSSHRFDPALVQPITLLGDIQAREGEYTDALESYGRAVHLQRVNDGLVSPEQVEIVYREADVYRTLGNLQAANEREEYAYHVLRRAFDSYDEALLPGIYHLARWYMSTHNLYSARALYQHALLIFSANGKDASLEAIEPLSGLPDTYRLERFPPFYISSTEDNVYVGMQGRSFEQGQSVVINNFPAGESALQTIIQIRRDNDAPPLEVAQSIVDLGDWYLMFDKSRRAFPLYEHVYQMLENLEAGSGGAFFAEPKLLYFPSPGDPRSSPATATQASRGRVALSFDLSDEGEIRNLRTLLSEPEGMMDYRVRKSMRIARYRPALVGGVPQTATDMTFEYDFTYYPQVAANTEPDPTDTVGAAEPEDDTSP